MLELDPQVLPKFKYNIPSVKNSEFKKRHLQVPRRITEKPKIQIWVAKAASKKSAECILSKKSTNISFMGSSALDSHAASKSHNIITDYIIWKYNYIFNIANQTRKEIYYETISTSANDIKAKTFERCCNW